MTLRYAHEVRREADYFGEIPDLTLPDEMLDLAEHILDTKIADFDPAFLEDRYRTVLVSMLREKQAAAVPKNVTTAAPSPQNVINLMDALKRSLETERPSLSRKPTSQHSAAGRKSPGRKARPPKAG
jgi:non-homologous end joining protein Ku